MPYNSIYQNNDISSSFDINDFVGFRVKLYPTEDQKKIFENYFGACRFIYNKCIDWQKDRYELHKKDPNIKSKIYYYEYSKLIIDLRKEYEWLKMFDMETLRYVSRNVLNAFSRFFNNGQGFPKYKSKKDPSTKKFPIRSDRLSIFKNHVRLPSIGIVKSINNQDIILGNGSSNIKTMQFKKYIMSYVICKGSEYYLAFLLPKNQEIREKSYTRYHNDIYINRKYTNPIGIDIGCSYNNWIVTSNGYRFCLPNNSRDYKRISFYQNKLSQKRKYNKERANLCFTNNERKLLSKIDRLLQKIHNRTVDAVYKATHAILVNKPDKIVLEDISLKDMYRNKNNCDWSTYSINKYNAKVKEHMPFTVRSIISRVSKNAGIHVIVASKYYPSSKLCNNCGYLYKNLGSSRIYCCPNCGAIMDRDLNAAINLSKYDHMIKPFTICA